MKYFLIYILLVSITTIKSYGQKYDYYGLSMRSVFLPMGLVKGESYFLDNKKDNVHVEFFNKSTNGSIFRNKLDNNNFSTKYIEIIDSLTNQNEFQIKVEKKIKDYIFSIISESNLNSFNVEEFNKYFSHDSTITLAIDKFEIDTSLSVPVFLDEPWFTLNIEYCYENSNDTIEKDIIFVSSDYIKTDNIKNWLIGFIVLNRMDLFNEMTTVKEVVTEQNLSQVLARYIITQEKKK